MLPYSQKTNTLLSFFAFLLLFNSPLSSQITVTQEPLIDIIVAIEKRFDVRFSYTISTIEDLNIIPSNPNLSLVETLDYLKANTELEFKIIGQRYIAIFTSIATGSLSICATIINTQTGLPIEDATVRGKSANVSTNKAGFFRLDGISGEEIITISYLGFDIKKMKGKDLVTQNKCPLIFANISFNFLDTVILENYITKGISKNAEGSISISQENFQILPSLIEPDVLQIAQIVPGVESVDETVSNINIRGGKNDEVLLLWNDIRMYQSSHLFGLISALNPNLTQDVTIFKNGTHPKYGEGVSGLISITSDNTIPENVTGGTGINLISANLYANIPASETFGITISGRTSINSGTGNPVYNQFYSRLFQNTIITNLNNNTSPGLRSTDEDLNFYDVSIKGVWKISKKDKLTYNFLVINNLLQFTELIVAENNSSSNQSLLEQSSNINGAQWQRNWNSKLSSKINWHGSNYLLEETNREVNTDSTTAQENEVKETEFKIEATYRFTQDLWSTAGYAYTDTNIINSKDPLVSTNTSLRRNAYFLNTHWMHNNQNTILSVGVRHTSYLSFGKNMVEPRFNVFKKITKNFSVTISGEQKNQGVLQFTDVDNQFLGVENKRWILANNEDLPILKSKQIALGSTFKKRDWSLNANIYYKKVNDISSGTQGFRNQLINTVTIGNYDAMGLEFSMNRKSKNLNLWLSYSFVESDYDFPEITPGKFRNNFAIKHSVNIAATFDHKSFLFSLGSTFKTGNPYTSVVEGNEIVFVNKEPMINYNAPNSSTLGNYFRTDFSAAFTFKMDETFRGKVNLALLNIFDRKNALETYYRLTTDEINENSINKIEQFSLGFTPNISFQIFF
ncbi:MAG: TonB-dependent receptor [Bacteroidetes bacterium]|nr:TonB-dependent receptor [Bacteroidota bacterium]